MRRRKIYEVLDTEYNKVFEGNATQCADFIGCDESHIRDCKEQRVVLRQYRIRRTDRMEPVQEKKKPEQELSYKTKPYECLVWHLKAHGNAMTMFNPSKYMGRLAEDGYDCTYREVYDYEENRHLRKNQKPKYFYIVEVDDAKGKRQSI